MGVSLLAGGLAIWGAGHSQLPAMLIALLLGAGSGVLRGNALLGSGLTVTVRSLTRIGVALLGFQISLGTVLQLGSDTLIFLGLATAATIGATVLIAPIAGQRRDVGLLIGGATAICGASAALAIAAVLPPSERLNRHLSFTIMAVTLLSTIAMVAYPAGLLAFGVGDARAGFVLGASIHDVAQVVGAGYAISDVAGETAIVVKLFRVMLLVPLIFCLARLARRGGGAGGGPRFPMFILAFLLAVIANSAGMVPAALVGTAAFASQLMLTASVYAVCALTPLFDITRSGAGPVAMAVFATSVILGLAVIASTWLLPFSGG
ncbi:MAG: putative sulfate exporter family transporter [Roseovarius sp.]